MEVEPATDPLEALTEFLYLVPVGLLQFRLNGKVDRANPMAAQLLMPFAPRGDLSDAYSALAPLVPDLARRVRQFSGLSGVVLDHERCAIAVAGHTVVLSVTVHRIHNVSNLAVIEDVTRLVEQERRLFEDQQRFRAIFDHVRDYAIYTVNQRGQVDEWNQSLQRFGGWRADDMVGQPLDVFFTEEDRAAGLVKALQAEARKTGSVETEGWCLRLDGSRVWANTVLTALPDADGAIRGFVVVCRDMTQRKRTEDELRRLATTDPLTGAFNRRHGHARLAQAFLATEGAKGRPGVLLLDIDHFKTINDRLGHDAGDAALCAVVNACHAALGEGLSVVRWGGEEFLVILPCTEVVVATETAERLRSTVSLLRVASLAGEITMTVSVGVAVDQGEGPEALVRRADAALYDAKRGGRDRVVVAV